MQSVWGIDHGDEVSKAFGSKGVSWLVKEGVKAQGGGAKGALKATKAGLKGAAGWRPKKVK